MSTEFCRRMILLAISIVIAMPSHACVEYRHNSDFPTARPQQIPIFHSIVDDKALVMFSDVKEIPVDGGTRIERRQVFNFAFCSRFQRFRRGQSEIYPKEACEPLSRMWIPVVDPDNPQQELITSFGEYVIHFLRESLEAQLDKIANDDTWVVIDGAAQRALLAGFATSTLVMAYRMTPPMSRMGRWGRRGMKAAGWLTLLGIGLSVWAEVENENSYENIYDKNLKELNSVLNSLDGKLRYYNEDTPNRPVIYVFEELNQAITKSMESMLYSQCGFI